MTPRLIDLMCSGHRALILGNRMWPPGFALADCPNCTDDRGKAAFLPGVSASYEFAVHEAGHAFSYLRDGLEVVEVNLAGNDRFAAYTNFVSFDLGSLTEATGLWAGPAAAREWLTRQGTLDPAAEVDIAMVSRSDVKVIVENARHPDDVVEARDRADALARRHWPAIERVADALLASGRLTGGEIAALSGITCNA